MARIPPGVATVGEAEVLVTFCKTVLFPIAPVVETLVAECRALCMGWQRFTLPVFATTPVGTV